LMLGPHLTPETSSRSSRSPSTAPRRNSRVWSVASTRCPKFRPASSPSAPRLRASLRHQPGANP
jgi:hypothetical protein